MVKSDRYMSAKNCPTCNHPHRSDHPHFKRFDLDKTDSPTAARPDAGAASSTPAVTPGEPPPTPIGTERGGLPGAAQEAMDTQRRRKRRTTTKDREQTEKEKISRLNACKMAVRMELAGLAVGMDDSRYRTLAAEKDIDELAQAWDAFAEVWGIETTGKLAVSAMLAASHGGLYMTLHAKVKAAGPKPEKPKEEKP